MDVESYIFLTNRAKSCMARRWGGKIGVLVSIPWPLKPCCAVFPHLLGIGCAGGPQCIYRFGGESWRHAPGS